MTIKCTTAFLRIILTLFFCFSLAAPVLSQTRSKATNPSSDLRPQDIQAAADKINRKLDSYGPYLSHLNEVAKDPGINSASMLLYYTDAFFKDSSYKKMIIFYFGTNKTLVDEYYPIKNKKYIVRMKLNTTLKQNQLNIKSFLHEYERMKKTLLSKYIFVDGILEVWVGPNAEIKTKIDDAFLNASDVLLQRERIAVNSVVMD